MSRQMNEAAQYLLRAIYQMHQKCTELNNIGTLKKTKNKALIKSGIVENIGGLKFLLQKIVNSDGRKSIGFFGGQKRGKSSLINRLLGCDLMPVGVNPMTSAIVNIENDPKMDEGKFEIYSEAQNGARSSHGKVNLEQAKSMLTEIVSHAGSLSSDVSHVRVVSKFPNSKILDKGGVLVDTPGAECAFGGRRKSKTSAENANKIDTDRAIRALKQINVVVFVEKPETTQCKSSNTLYSKYVRDMRPICVVNFMDQYDLDAKVKKRLEELMQGKGKQALEIKMNEEKAKTLKTKMMKVFGAVVERTFCISCKENGSVARQTTAIGKKTANADRNQTSGREEPNPIKDLESKIIEEIGNLEAAKGVLTSIRDLGQFLAQIEECIQGKVKEVFSAGLASMCVFINSVARITADEKSREEVVKAATSLFEKYAPRDRRKFLNVKICDESSLEV